MGWHEDPTENHLFMIDLEDGDWRRLTNTGWHSCFLDTKTERVIDYFSNSEFLPKIKLRSLPDFDNEVVIREENWGKDTLTILSEIHTANRFVEASTREMEQNCIID